MSDDPFADLGDTLDDDQEESDGQERAAYESEEATETMPTQDPIEAEHDPMTDVAFSYDEAQQQPISPREDMINDFDAWLKFELKREFTGRSGANQLSRPRYRASGRSNGHRLQTSVSVWTRRRASIDLQPT